MGQEQNRLYTTQEAAALIGISDGYLRTLVTLGKATPTTEIGGTLMFDMAEIERVMQRPTRKGRPPKK
jgi:predicted site-specific integrase-resolvase